MRRTLLIGLGLVLLLAWAAPVHADLILLKDGRIFERSGMERVEEGVTVHFENGDVMVPAMMIEVAVIENQPAFVPKTPEEQEKLDKGLVPFEGKWVKLSKRDDLIQKRIAERKAAIDEIRAHMLWRHKLTEKTKHFEFEYTVPPHIFEYFRDLMEAYYKEFAKTWKIKQPKDLGRLQVCFYSSADKFQQISGARRGTLAYFRFVAPLELNFYYDRTDKDLTEQVMYHEANHYLQMLMNPRFNMPHFPGEALAEYYGASKFNPKTKKLETGLILEGRLTEVQMDILAGKMMSLEKMLTTDGMYQHYTWGWSLAHFLMNDKSTRKKFERFVKDLVAGKGVQHEASVGRMSTVPMKEVWAHFKRCMGLKEPEDVTELETAWHTYVKEGLKLVTSRGLEKAATRAMNQGRVKRAARLFKEAIEKGTDSALTYHHYADVLDREGKRSESVKYRQKALELAPLESSFYVELGRALRFGGGDVEEGKRLMKLALELDPDNPYLQREIERLEKEGS